MGGRSLRDLSSEQVPGVGHLSETIVVKMFVVAVV